MFIFHFIINSQRDNYCPFLCVLYQPCYRQKSGQFICKLRNKQYIILMNTIYIGPKQTLSTQANVYSIDFDVADKFLQILRADFFNKINIVLPENISDRNLKFMMHLNRVLTKKGSVQIQNTTVSQSTKKFVAFITKLGFFDISDQKTIGIFTKTRPEVQKVQSKKLSIGFQGIQDQQIDQDDLMKNQNLTIKKQKAQNCAEKVRTCANCNCGRKDAQTPQISKQQLVKAVNDGKPSSGCGKCYLGDSFRCGTCPYKGMPAFKPGDKLRLQEEGGIVVVQTGAIKLDAGKVKLQL